MKYGLLVVFIVAFSCIALAGCTQSENIVPSPSATPVGTAVQEESLVYTPVQVMKDEPQLPPGTIVEVYNETIDLTYGGEVVFPYYLISTPMVVTFKVYPEIVEYEKFLSSDVGYSANTSKHWTTTVMEHLDAWAEVKLVDRTTGKTLKSDGYNGVYSGDKFGTFSMTLPGSYEVVFTGYKAVINATVTAPV